MMTRSAANTRPGASGLSLRDLPAAELATTADGVASSMITASRYASMKVRPSPNTLFQNRPDAITSSTSTKPTNATRSCTGAVDRVTTDLKIFEAKSIPPQTTRAKLRGEFIRRAQEKRRDFTVDWVHLKLNDQAQRTVLCKDPFRSVDERVEKLIAGM